MRKVLAVILAAYFVSGCSLFRRSNSKSGSDGVQNDLANPVAPTPTNGFKTHFDSTDGRFSVDIVGMDPNGPDHTVPMGKTVIIELDIRLNDPTLETPADYSGPAIFVFCKYKVQNADDPLPGEQSVNFSGCRDVRRSGVTQVGSIIREAEEIKILRLNWYYDGQQNRDPAQPHQVWDILLNWKLGI